MDLEEKILMNGKTYKNWLSDAISKLNNVKVDFPHLVAEVILSNALSLERASIIAHSDNSLSIEELQIADEMLEKRITGTPLSYVLEETEFFSLKIRVTPAVLVPESETEHLVQAVLDIAAYPEYENMKEITLIDIGTGSGCILAAIGVNDARFVGFGTDISTEALKIAEYNLNLHDVSKRFQLIQSDMFASIPVSNKQESVQKFDFIVSNPPYIGFTERKNLRPEVLTQPDVSLFGGEIGTEFTIKLLSESYPRLKQGGYLIIEIGQDTQHEIIHTAEKIGFRYIKSIYDYTHIERILSFSKPNSNEH